MSKNQPSESESARQSPVPLVRQSALRALDHLRAMAVQKRDSACYYDPGKDKRRKKALKHAQQTNKALKVIITILYNGTEIDLDELKAWVKSFASAEAVMEKLLEHEGLEKRAPMWGLYQSKPRKSKFAISYDKAHSPMRQKADGIDDTARALGAMPCEMDVHTQVKSPSTSSLLQKSRDLQNSITQQP
ncbi:hypothetical protein BDV10DRAFT_189850 [Aspergillus recurvatus]